MPCGTRCAGRASGDILVLHRELGVEAASAAWDATADRSSWAITLGNPKTAKRCAAAEAEAAQQAADVQDLVEAGPAGSRNEETLRMVEGVATSPDPTGNAQWSAHASGGAVCSCFPPAPADTVVCLHHHLSP